VATRGWTIDTGVSIVIPAFNEAHRLPTTLDRLLLDLPTVFDDWEVVVIDDG
jgi:glycosyltransferase involved in cell wall biosynthesis